MKPSLSFLLLTQLFVLAIAQQPPKRGLVLFLESAMKEFPEWLKSKLGDPLLQPGTILITEQSGFNELSGEIRDLALNGYTEQYASVYSYYRRGVSVHVNFLPNLEIVGNYSLKGRVSDKTVSGEGVFKLMNFRYSDNSYVSINVQDFGITSSGQIDLTTANVYPYSRIFDQSLPEFESLESGGYSKHIGESIKSYFVDTFQRLLMKQLETYIRIALENASLSKILRDDYDGNLNNSFVGGNPFAIED